MLASAVVLTAAVALSAWLMNLSFERAVVLTPALVVGLGLLAMVLVVLGRAAADSLRRSRRPRVVVGLWVGGIALLVVLSVLGVKLPHE
jgi:hypothetical protein